MIKFSHAEIDCRVHALEQAFPDLQHRTTLTRRPKGRRFCLCPLPASATQISGDGEHKVADRAPVRGGDASSTDPTNEPAP
jgi:hypothetical protein